MDTFDICKKINMHLLDNNEFEARNAIIKLLDKKNDIEPNYYQLIAHLIRETGLYIYLDVFDCQSIFWDDRYICEIFKSDCGYNELVTLHREQSCLLKQLLDGKDIIVSAPTSFGKSFIIDAFIAIKKPKNIVIIVPTIALTDETRRRLYKKFSDEYKIITTSSSDFGDKNIFIFPLRLHWAVFVSPSG
jgi:reverse gyrase